ncbi:MAG: hypothetical protein K1X74_07270 [Pirellulales bacterium]|nr:hypothetical protein [Pirellulales bacterium]
MSPFQPQLAEVPHRAAPAEAPGTTTLLQCLVVAIDAQRREQLAWSAGQSGWRAIPCLDAEVAESWSRRTFVQLAVIDLEHPAHAAQLDLIALIERLGRSGTTLLVVCGNEGNLQEEIWARQIGVWMYLPGVGEPAELAQLLGEAREIAQRLAPAASLASRQQTAASDGAAAVEGFGQASSSHPRRRRWSGQDLG